MPRVKAVPIVVGGVRYQSINQAATSLGCKKDKLRYLLLKGRGYNGLSLDYAPEVLEARRQRRLASKRDRIAEWYKRHKYERPYMPRKQEREPGAPLLRKRMLGLGEAKE